MAAFARIYDQTLPKAFELAMRMLGNRSEAEGVLHMVYLDLWRDFSSLDSASPRVIVEVLVRVRAVARTLPSAKDPSPI